MIHRAEIKVCKQHSKKWDCLKKEQIVSAYPCGHYTEKGSPCTRHAAYLLRGATEKAGKNE